LKTVSGLLGDVLSSGLQHRSHTGLRASLSIPDRFGELSNGAVLQIAVSYPTDENAPQLESNRSGIGSTYCVFEYLAGPVANCLADGECLGWNLAGRRVLEVPSTRESADQLAARTIQDYWWLRTGLKTVSGLLGDVLSSGLQHRSHTGLRASGQGADRSGDVPIV
jgi:hypothetical protein